MRAGLPAQRQSAELAPERSGNLSGDRLQLGRAVAGIEIERSVAGLQDDDRRLT
jgi:hypothetical protein